MLSSYWSFSLKISKRIHLMPRRLIVSRNKGSLYSKCCNSIFYRFTLVSYWPGLSKYIELNRESKKERIIRLMLKWPESETLQSRHCPPFLLFQLWLTSPSLTTQPRKHPHQSSLRAALSALPSASLSLSDKIRHWIRRNGWLLS